MTRLHPLIHQFCWMVHGILLLCSVRSDRVWIFQSCPFWQCFLRSLTDSWLLLSIFCESQSNAVRSALLANISLYQRYLGVSHCCNIKQAISYGLYGRGHFSQCYFACHCVVCVQSILSQNQYSLSGIRCSDAAGWLPFLFFSCSFDSDFRTCSFNSDAVTEKSAPHLLFREPWPIW